MKTTEIKQQPIELSALVPTARFALLVELQRLAIEVDYNYLRSRDPEGAPDKKHFARAWLQQCSKDFREWYERIVEDSPTRLPELLLAARRGLQDAPALA